MEMTLKGTPKEFAALVPELQERQDADEVDVSKATYLAWKEDLKRTGRTPGDVVEQFRALGVTVYADCLEKAISQMEELL